MNKRIFAVFAIICCLTLRAENGPALEPNIAVYRWAAANRRGGPAGNEAFAKWLHRPLVWGEDFTPTEHWSGHIEGGDWQLKPWSEWKKAVPGRRLIYGIPLLPGPWDRSGEKLPDGRKAPVSLHAGARGDYNEHFKRLAENLVKYDLADSILRLGWEFNGGWYTWRAQESPESYAAYWQQIVKTMRAVPGAESLRFCWNPAQGYQGFPAEKAWPGDDCVDIVGLDLYDEAWTAKTYPIPENATAEVAGALRKKVWEQVLLNGDHGLAFWAKFAAKHGKPFAIPEWGVNRREDKHSGGDNAYFIEQMHAFIIDPANSVLFHCYFDVQAGDGHHQLSPGLNGDEKTEFPAATVRFRQLFSASNR